MNYGRIRTSRLLTGLAGLALVPGIMTTALQGAPPAAAATATAQHTTSRPATPYGLQWCYYSGKFACLNAWGGGPWVDTYTGGPEDNDTNQMFSTVTEGSYTDLSWTGGSGECIGDAYNSSSYADTSLDPCGSGWGTNFTEGSSGCPQGDDWFYNSHWKGYLGPVANWTNGSHFYLNKPTPYCYSQSFFAGTKS